MPHQDMASSSGHPFVRIVEQPAGKALRFRYECEGRSAGSIPGCNSTPERKTYPTIEIHGHRGWAIIVVSCVTRDAPHKPHPHNLVGRERCENGVCTVKTNITDENPQVSFSNLGIQCVKRKDIAEALRTRERLRVDPFRTGFGHMNQLQSIDLNAVRLCFQVFIQDEKSGKIRRSLPPVVSDVIYDKKAMSDLYIMRVSHCSAPPKGGTEVILLCERITKEDIAVVFFEKEGDRVVWEEAANIILVHRQYAIVFHTPPYRQPAATSNVQVFLQLKRTSDDARSNPLPFEYTPDLNPDASHLARKRQKTISSLLQQYEPNRNFQDQQIKAEPNKTPPHHLGSPLQVYSPHYEQEQVQENMSYQWTLQEPSMSGLSHVNYTQDVQWSPNYMQMANLQSVSPNLQSTSPNLQSVSPNLQAMSPNMQAMSPNMQAMSPNMQQNLQAMSPMHMQMSGMGRISPMTHGGMSPNLSHVSPGLGHSPGLGQPSTGLGQPSPGLGQPSPGLGQPSSAMGHVSPHMMHDQSVMMEMNPPDPPSFTLTSGELSGLDALLGRGPDLSDSLNRLSTSDLLH